jgi:hypothetical protein
MNKINKMNPCPSSASCNKALCPFDLSLTEQSLKESDKCRFMKNPKRKKVKGREFMAGGAVMPDGLLRSVPQCNLKLLNEANKEQWAKLQDLESK